MIFLVFQFKKVYDKKVLFIFMNNKQNVFQNINLDYYNYIILYDL